MGLRPEICLTSSALELEERAPSFEKKESALEALLKAENDLEPVSPKKEETCFSIPPEDG
jgi:hypothetical protein